MFAITNYVLQLWLQQSKVWLVSGIPAHCRWSFIFFLFFFTVSCVLSLNVFRNKPAELEYTFYLTYKLHPIFLKSVSCNYRQRYIFKFWIDREKFRSLSGFYCCLYFCFEVWGHGGGLSCPVFVSTWTMRGNIVIRNTLHTLQPLKLPALSTSPLLTRFHS